MHPFDFKTALLAKHAQHVVLVHFPIALFITGVFFDCVAWIRKRPILAQAAYYNLMAAAITTLPVIATGILAWRFQLEGQRLAGILRWHLILALVSSGIIWLVWSIHHRARRLNVALPRYRLLIELAGVLLVAMAAHLGGFLSGVNIPS